MAAAPILAAVSIGTSLIGAGMSYMGAQQQAKAASDQAAYNAQVARNNQILADNAATVAKQEGAIEQQQKANQENVLLGQQQAALAANGVDVGSGSAVDLLSDTKANGMFDQLTIANNASRTAQGYTNQGISYQNQAQLDEAQSKNALAAGQLSADAALIGGVGSVATQWYNFSYNPSYRQLFAAR